MLRTLSMAALTTGLLASPALAQDAKAEADTSPVKVDGSFWTRFELREGYDKLGVSRARFQEGDAFFYRARMGLTAKSSKFGQHTVTPRLVLQSSGMWGTTPGTISDAAVNMHEGYVRVAGPTHRFDVGRFEMNYGEAMVIGNLGWHQTARSFDGFRYRQGKDAHKWVDLFVTMARPTANPAEGHPNPEHDEAFEGDAYFLGLYGDLGGFITDKFTLELYGLLQAQTAVNDENAAQLFTVGTRVKKGFGATTVRLEAGAQFGGADNGEGDADDVSFSAYQADLEIGHKFSKMFWMGLGGSLVSGDDPTTNDKNEGWQQLYPTAHKFFGLMDVAGGRTNLTSGRVRFRVVPRNGTKILLDAHMFMRPEPGKNAAGEDIDGYAGSELDLNVVQHIGGGLSVRGLYGVFLPNGKVRPLGGELAEDGEMAHYVALQLSYGFK